MTTTPLPEPVGQHIIQRTAHVEMVHTYTADQLHAHTAAVTAAKDAEIERLTKVHEAALRLVQHADFKLGGILSADSKAKDIPSTAVSQVKARHLASLRDAINAALESK